MTRISPGYLIALWLMTSGTGLAADREVTIGYQAIVNPWKVAIHDGEFEKATGYRIHWRTFDSGAKVISALVLGDVQIATLGSAPIAAAVSRGLDLQLFWILEDIGDSEALVARQGAGIAAPANLRGKTIGVPFFSTSHFHLAFALHHYGIAVREVTLVNLQPNQIASAWLRGDIDAAYVWPPVLTLIEATGRVLVTSGELGALGKATFDGLVVRRAFAEANGGFMATLVRLIAAADERYRRDPDAWTPDSPMVRAIADRVGAEPQDVPKALALYRFPTLQEQVSCAWLGCGGDGGAARALRYTAEFLVEQGQLDAALSDYSRFVTPRYVEAVLEAP